MNVMKNMKRLSIFSAAAAALALASSAFAVPTITIGDVQLQPNLKNQKVAIAVTGGDPVEGLDLDVMVGDGGPGAGGKDVTPAITDLDIVGAGTIFNPNNTTSENGSKFTSPGFAIRTTTTTTGTVPANGVLAFVTFDTTNIATGTSFPLRLTGTPNGDTDFGTVKPNITNGTVTVVPEPAGLSVLALGSLGLLARRRK